MQLFGVNIVRFFNRCKARSQGVRCLRKRGHDYWHVANLHGGTWYWTEEYPS